LSITVADLMGRALEDQQDQGDQTIGFEDILAKLRKHKFAILAIVAASIVVGIFISRSLPEVYTANVKLVLESRGQKLFEAIPDGNEADVNRQSFETELQVINSRLLAGRVVDDLDLVNDPYFGSVQSDDEDEEPGGFLSNSLGTVKSWVRSILGVSSESKTQPMEPEARRESVISTFLSNFHVSNIGQSLAMFIEVSHNDPQRAAEIANAIADTYLTLSVERRRVATEKAIEFLSKRAEKLGSDLSNQEQEIIEQKLKYRLDDAEYPTMLSAEIERLKVQKQLLATDDSQVAGDDTDVHQLDMEILSKSLELKARKIAETDLRLMERETELTQERYQKVVERLGDLDLTAEQLNEPGRVLSYAQMPRTPTSPKRTLIVAVSFLAGSALALLYALLREAFDRRFWREADLVRAMSLPSLGMIPEVKGTWSNPRRTPQDSILENQSSQYADIIRQIVTACNDRSPGDPGKAVLVTSCLPNEGKTTTALSMAYLAALEGNNTVLLDLDIHKASSSRAIGITRKTKSLDQLVGTGCDLEEAIYNCSKVPQLDVIGFSRIPANGETILNRKEIGEIIGELKKRYEIIIIDAPPVLLAGSASYLARFADQAIVLLRWGHIDQETLSSALKKLRQFASLPIGLVISRVDFAKQAKIGNDVTAKYQAYKSYYYQN
jgi:succinoglycan biosynthesis transport protein ExoP